MHVALIHQKDWDMEASNLKFHRVSQKESHRWREAITDLVNSMQNVCTQRKVLRTFRRVWGKCPIFLWELSMFKQKPRNPFCSGIMALTLCERRCTREMQWSARLFGEVYRFDTWSKVWNSCCPGYHTFWTPVSEMPLKTKRYHPLW